MILMPLSQLITLGLNLMLWYIFNLPPEFESLGIMLLLLSHRPSYNIHVYSIKRLIIEVIIDVCIYSKKKLGYIIRYTYTII